MVSLFRRKSPATADPALASALPPDLFSAAVPAPAISEPEDQARAALTAVAQYLSDGLLDLTVRPELRSNLPEAALLSQRLAAAVADVREVLESLQDLVTTAGAGAARNSVRLQAVTGRVEEIHRGISEISQATEQLHQGIRQVAQAAGEAAETAHHVDRLTAAAQDKSEQAMTSARSLRDHMHASAGRLGALVERVRAITRVSQVIEGIAARTNLLALNAAIEAARAGAAGRGFAVVADEVRKLAEGTSGQTKEIGALVRAIAGDLEPAQASIAESCTLADGACARSNEVGAALREIFHLSRASAGHMENIAATVEEQSAAVESVFMALRQAEANVAGIKTETEHVTRDTFLLATLTEDGHRYLGRHRTGSMFHRVLELTRELAARSGSVLEQLVDQGQCHLQDVLALQYTEIKGPAIRSLSKLFDVSRVPPAGFTPPKYSTAYDALVDLAMQKLLDEILAREPKLNSTGIMDLNTYVPAHNRISCQDWTGVPAKDLVGNRVKRFFSDQAIMVRGVRVGLGGDVDRLPGRTTRQQFIDAGCDLREPAGGSRDFLVQTYARDTGEVITCLTVPLYVKGQRYGAAIVGWNVEISR